MTRIIDIFGFLWLGGVAVVTLVAGIAALAQGWWLSGGAAIVCFVGWVLVLIETRPRANV